MRIAFFFMKKGVWKRAWHRVFLRGRGGSFFVVKCVDLFCENRKRER